MTEADIFMYVYITEPDKFVHPTEVQVKEWKEVVSAGAEALESVNRKMPLPASFDVEKCKSILTVCISAIGSSWDGYVHNKSVKPQRWAEWDELQDNAYKLLQEIKVKEDIVCKNSLAKLTPAIFTSQMQSLGVFNQSDMRTIQELQGRPENRRRIQNLGEYIVSDKGNLDRAMLEAINCIKVLREGDGLAHLTNLKSGEFLTAPSQNFVNLHPCALSPEIRKHFLAQFPAKVSLAGATPQCWFARLIPAGTKHLVGEQYWAIFSKGFGVVWVDKRSAVRGSFTNQTTIGPIGSTTSPSLVPMFTKKEGKILAAAHGIIFLNDDVTFNFPLVCCSTC
jgi:hypothetical protein